MTKQEAARQRVEYALRNVSEAQQTIDKALQALSSVIGVTPLYKQLRKVLRDRLDSDRRALGLDREPDEKEERRYAAKES